LSTRLPVIGIDKLWSYPRRLGGGRKRNREYAACWRCYPTLRSCGAPTLLDAESAFSACMACTNCCSDRPPGSGFFDGDPVRVGDGVGFIHELREERPCHGVIPAPGDNPGSRCVRTCCSFPPGPSPPCAGLYPHACSYKAY
jgi:hypothetical protein